MYARQQPENSHAVYLGYQESAGWAREFESALKKFNSVYEANLEQFHTRDYTAMGGRIMQAVLSSTPPDGILVTLPSEALVAPVRAALDANIPVVSFLRGASISRSIRETHANGEKLIAHVGEDEAAAGYKVAKALGYVGGLLVVDTLNTTATRDRLAGVEKYAAETSQSVTVTDRPPTDQSGQGVIYLSPDTTVKKPVFSDSNIAPVAVFGANTELAAAVREGYVKVALWEQPFLFASLPLVVMHFYRESVQKPADPEILTGLLDITQDNLPSMYCEPFYAPVAELNETCLVDGDALGREQKLHVVTHANPGSQFWDGPERWLRQAAKHFKVDLDMVKYR